MKKIVYLGLAALIAISFVGCKESKIKTPKSLKEVKAMKIDVSDKVTVAQCKKYLGEKNYNFINKLSNSEDAALLKCKEEMKR